MADIELVIKISEELYQDIKENGLCGYCSDREIVSKAIANGTPLPKGHGRIIDAGEYENSIRKHYFDNSTVIRCTEIALDNAPTVVEADKEVSE